jgi:hypothetical protein
MGRGSLDTFLNVTLPQIRSSVIAGALLAALYAMSDFGVVSLLRCTTLTREAFLRYDALYDPAGAAAVGTIGGWMSRAPERDGARNLLVAEGHDDVMGCDGLAGGEASGGQPAPCVDATASCADAATAASARSRTPR